MLSDIEIAQNAQMKDITDSSFNFRQTMFSISEEAAKKIINYVRNNN